MYDDVENDTGISKRMLQEYKQVSTAIEPRERFRDLSFNHHKQNAKNC